MADHPEGEQITTGDRTSALVASGLVVLAVLGVVTIFSDVIAAAWSPSGSTSGVTTATEGAPAPSLSPSPGVRAGDGGPA